MYRAWGDYFETRLEGKVNYDHENNTVTAIVPAMPEPVTLDSGVVAAGNLSIGSNASGVDGDVSLGGTTDDEGRIFGIVTENVTGNEQIESAASKIDAAYKRLQNESVPANSDDITAGEYFVEDDDDLFSNGGGPGNGNPGGGPQSGTTFNTTKGDIELFVDGELKANKDITIVGNGDVQIYVNGTLHMKGQSKWGIGSQVNSLTAYSRDVDRLTGFYGVLYTDAISVAGTGAQAGLVGALITTADTVQMTGNMNITYDNSLEDETLIEVEIERGGPARIKYIQIRRTELT